MRIITVEVARGQTALGPEEWRSLLSAFSIQTEEGRLLYMLEMGGNHPLRVADIGVERAVVSLINWTLRHSGKRIRVGVQLRIPWEKQILAVCRVINEPEPPSPKGA